MHLLVVDDDAAVREALELVLDLSGFEVATAADGREAIRRLARDSPDAVILDVLMPGLDGLEVCRRIRATGDRTPVLMLTARAEVSERVAGLEAGAETTWPSRLPARSWSLACARCCGARAGRGTTNGCCDSRISSSIRSRTRHAATAACSS